MTLLIPIAGCALFVAFIVGLVLALRSYRHGDDLDATELSPHNKTYASPSYGLRVVK